MPADKPVVGVTGGIGSGKTAVTDYLQALGITVVDADLASRVIMEPGRPALDAVAERFGNDILLPDGQLDRAALRRIVFADPEQRRWLEQLTHPLIGEEIRHQLGAAASPYAVLSSPLLLETGQKDLCDMIVVVDVSEAVQLERTMRRDDNNEDQVRRIMAAQLAREQRLAGADRVIDNSGSLEALHSQLDQLHAELLERYANP
ncbi:MAG: dephospho-CoA kinase [Halieaceae bacterium]|nr:dephospho-CoA kinase [Halieaceae bacterium]